jgi:hypothetical protein
MREYYRAVSQSHVGFWERIACHCVLAKFVLKHVPKLVRDLLIASEQFTRRSLRRRQNPGDNAPLLAR